MGPLMEHPREESQGQYFDQGKRILPKHIMRKMCLFIPMHNTTALGKYRQGLRALADKGQDPMQPFASRGGR